MPRKPDRDDYFEPKRFVRAITVSPQFWMEEPEKAARLIVERMKEKPAELWFVAIGEADPAAKMMDALFIYGGAEPEVRDD